MITLEDAVRCALAALNQRKTYPADVALARRVLSEAIRDSEALAPYTCPLCGQRITDGKPCGCGARNSEGVAS